MGLSQQMPIGKQLKDQDTLIEQSPSMIHSNTTVLHAQKLEIHQKK